MARRRRHNSAEDPREPRTWRADDGGPRELYARALLERAEITERYFVEQEISRNSWTRAGRSPAGRIELAMPYDGHTHFTRAAIADVVRQARSEAGLGGGAVIGHLVLKDFPPVHFQDWRDLGGRYGSMAIKVPLGPGAPDDLDQLSADQRIGATRCDFQPDEAAVIPARLEIDLFDPDSLDLPPADLRVFEFDTDEARQGINDGIAKIVRHVSFKDELVMQIVVHASLPDQAELGRPQPRVSRVAIRWPTITSLESLRLEIASEQPQLGRPLQLSKRSFQYNPVTRCVEWYLGDKDACGKMYSAEGKAEANERPGRPEEPGTGEEAQADDKPEKDNQDQEPELIDTGEDGPGAGIVRNYKSMPMLLSIRHPGELYKRDDLEVTAEVQVPGYLLSGMSARVYDATGYFLKKPLKLTTRIYADATLRLDDAFAMRDRSPSQHLFFDEVIPDEVRITDIKMTLEDRGFAVQKVWSSDAEARAEDDESGAEQDKKPKTDSWLLVAHRKMGPDDIVLWILAEGTHAGTDRDRVMPGGGVMHKTWLPSGELRLVIRGSLPGDGDGRLTHEMNALHGMLWERYTRLRQQR
jgi:hypothetical protein